MKAALYARVSTLDQNPNLQVEELQSYTNRQGRAIGEIYQDIISGAKTRRPGLPTPASRLPTGNPTKLYVDNQPST